MSARAKTKKNKGSTNGDVTASSAPMTAPAPDSYHRRQTALVALGRRAIAPPDIRLLIQDAAALIAETLDTDQYGAAELSADGKALMLRLGKIGSPESDDPLVEQRIDFNPRESLAAQAVETGHFVVAPDPAKRTLLADPFLQQQGIRAALLVPLVTAEQSFGALGAFSTRPREFLAEDLLFAETIAHLVSTTISRDYAHKALEAERRLTERILATVDALVLTLDPAGQILGVNPACQRTTGFTATELANRHIWNTLVVHDDVRVMQAALELAGDSDTPVERETLIVSKSGERRRIRWSLAGKRNDAGSVDAIIGTGIDVTDQRAAEEKIAQLEAEALADVPPGSEATQGQFRPLSQAPRGERRKRPRRTFNFMQRIAPMIGDKLPDRRQFHTVHCQDISSAGFSFIVTEPPSQASYVVALGTAAVTIYLTAKIIHVTSVIRDDTTKYLVGCQYVGRADYGRKAAAAK
jgi:PAS domain S-box-containing protein